MSGDDLDVAAFLAGVPRWTDELSRAVRDKQYLYAKQIAGRLSEGFGIVASITEDKKEG